MAVENRENKDRVFTDLFYSDQYADMNLLSVYNALFDTRYTDPKVIEKVRLEDVLFMNMKNDVAFTVEGKRIILAEHQSTINPNLPLRGLMYLGREYERLIPIKQRYSSRMIPIPTPELITFYNGNVDMPLESIYRLSDAFIEKEIRTQIELEVRVININYNKKHEILEKCHILKEYSQFNEMVRMHKNEKNSLEKAVNKCIENNILREYLSRRGSEVVNMLMAEYDYEMDMAVKQEEAKEEGREEGRKEGRELLLDELIHKKLNKGKSIEQIADELEVNVQDILEYIQK